MRLAILVLVVFTLPVFTYSATIEVPKDYADIQLAINAATTGDVVLVSPGTYFENIDFDGKAITVTSTGGAGVTIIDGGKNRSVVVFENGEGLDSVLDGFTITNGSATPNGGGICCDSSSPTIINNTISNSVAVYGGGIICYDHASPDIKYNTICGNTIPYSGGGICCWNYSSPTITDNIISGNRCNNGGGGIYCYDNSSPVITNNIVTTNTASNSEGGGIYFIDDSSPTITNNTITGNTAIYGAGICSTNINSSTITNNTITGNTAEYGGGISCSSFSSPAIKNNTIYGNTANFSGGGIYLNSASPTILNNTLSGNTSVYGGGIYISYASSPTVTDTIIWGNSGSEIWIGTATVPSILTISYCDLEGGKSSVHVESGSTLNWGVGMIDNDPLFVAGANGFLYLSQIAAGQPADSPCVNTGSGLASNLGLDTHWTRTDEAPDSGVVDMGFHYGLFIYPRLQSDVFQISASTGGLANLLLYGEMTNANRDYLILGNASVSGTSPGIMLPGNQATLPLNWDIFTDLVIANINTAFFSNFMGELDSTGSSKAIFNTFGPTGSATIGFKMRFAYALKAPWDFVSNPVEILITP